MDVQLDNIWLFFSHSSESFLFLTNDSYATKIAAQREKNFDSYVVVFIVAR